MKKIILLSLLTCLFLARTAFADIPIKVTIEPLPGTQKNWEIKITSTGGQQTLTLNNTKKEGSIQIMNPPTFYRGEYFGFALSCSNCKGFKGDSCWQAGLWSATSFPDKIEIRLSFKDEDNPECFAVRYK